MGKFLCWDFVPQQEISALLWDKGAEWENHQGTKLLIKAIAETSSKALRRSVVWYYKMTLFGHVFVFAPASEVSCPLPEPHPFLSSPDSSSSGCSSWISHRRMKGKQKYRTKKLSKDHISSPNNFKHLYHIGRSPQTGFASNLAPELKTVFAQAGVTQDHLKDKRTSKKTFEMMEKQGGIEAILNEAKTKGLLVRSPSPSLPSEPSSAHHLKNKIECQILSGKNGLKQVPTGPSSISEAQRMLQSDIPSAVITSAPSMSPTKRKPQYNLILNLKEVHLKRAKSDHVILPDPGALMHQIKKEAQLNLCPSDGGIIAALKDVIQKKHKMIHISDEESDLEKGDEWDEDVTTPQEERQ